MLNKKKGITLIELLGAIVISAIAVGLVASIFISFATSLNAIYARGSANSQGIYVTTKLLRTLNDFEAQIVSINLDEDTVTFEKPGSTLIVRSIQYGDNYRLEIEKDLEIEEIEVINHIYSNIQFSIDESDNGRLKTVDIFITISNEGETYEFIVSFLVIVYN